MLMEFLLWLQGFRSEGLSQFLNLYTSLFNGILLAAGFYCYWCADKRRGKAVLLSYFFAAAIMQIAKIFLRVPRPWVLDDRIQPDPIAVDGATGYSCPSGHSQMAASLGSAYAMTTRKKGWKWFYGISIGVVMFSRMYFGVHTPLDVLSGCALGVLVSWLILRRPDAPERTNRIIRAMAVVCAGGILCAAWMDLSGSVEFSMLYDTLKSCSLGLGIGCGLLLEQEKVCFENRKGRQMQVILPGALGALALYLPNHLLGHTWWVLLFYGFMGIWASYLWPLLFSRCPRRGQGKEA